MNAEELEILREIRDELRLLRIATENGKGGQDKHATAAAIAWVAAMRESFGDFEFTAPDLAAAAALPRAAALKSSTVAAIGSLQPRRMGKALARMEGRDVAGLVVRRHGSGRDGVLWIIREFASSKLENTVSRTGSI